MKKKLYILTVLVGTLVTQSCVDLDITDKNKITNPWASSQSGQLYLNTLYNQSLPTAGFGQNASKTEESDGIDDLIQGRLEAGSIGDYSGTTYERIRNINIGIEDCLNSDLNQQDKDAFLGQMYFLRAYEYFELTKLYGGVPIILEAQNPIADAGSLNVPRSTAKVCFERIIQDLDFSVKYCPDAFPESERGQITKMAAAAFRGRVYLTFASPLFNPQNDQQRWIDAYNACVEAKNLCLAQGRDLYPNFKEMFWVEGLAANREIVWVVPYSFAVGKTISWENSIRPSSMAYVRASRPGSVPTVGLTNAFLMKDGSKIGESSTYTYDMQGYWLNRDARLGATIAYNGCGWDLNGIPKRQQWAYQGMAGETLASILNLGAFCRKASMPSLTNNATAGEYTASYGMDWIEIRYAEVLLNLAECANEAGFTSDAYTELYAIRKRAGIDDNLGTYGLPAGLSKENLREVIMNERLAELAYENKRYWDMRRRLMYTEALGSNTPSFNSTKNRYTYVVRAKSPYTATQINTIIAAGTTIDIDTQYATYFNITENKRDVQYPINYLYKYYFFDIPSNILQRSIAVEQTIGWTDTRVTATGSGSPGTFDPLSDQGGTPWKGKLEQ